MYTCINMKFIIKCGYQMLVGKKKNEPNVDFFKTFKIKI